MSAGVTLHSAGANLFEGGALALAILSASTYAQAPPPGPAFHNTQALRIDAQTSLLSVRLGQTFQF